jgi:Na+-driven multidrug efflux pump
MTLQVYGYLFSDDVDVVKLVGQVMPLVASFQVADGLAGSCGGVLRGQGTIQQFIFALISVDSELQVASILVRYSTALHTTCWLCHSGLHLHSIPPPRLDCRDSG